MREKRRVVAFIAVSALLSQGHAAHAQSAGESPDRQPERQQDLPEVVVDRDDFVIDESCRVRIPKDLLIPDINGNGVIHIRADGITVEFVEREAELIAVERGTPWDTLTGIGIVIDGFKNVTLKGPHAHRFRCGIYARRANGLTIESADVAGGYAQRLNSTPRAEDSGDWLWPHRNDANEWLTNYGAGIYIEESREVTISGVYARRRQNGIILDRVSNSSVSDCDLSFLSGWGIAMWRSSDNVISRNKLDFCIRGYSHGVYNRGQDSAGILMFEQCNRNVIAENSATHGGDGLFAFGGRDALGEVWLEWERDRLRKETGRQDVDDLIELPEELIDRFRRLGNNDNLIVGNDFSYAAAHGLELTFSFGNKIIDNRLVGNAICGIWGGYSQDTVISGNRIEDNGDAGYGLERGGVNIEHGRGNVIVRNAFKGNACGVHLWWDPDQGFLTLPWAIANGREATAKEATVDAVSEGDLIVPSEGNVVALNAFTGDAVAIQLRGLGELTVSGNEFTDVGEAIVAASEHEVTEVDSVEMPVVRFVDVPIEGDSTAVGSRSELRGRSNIVMSEWFPWDHRGPLVRELEEGDGRRVFEVLNVAADELVVEAGRLEHEVISDNDGNPARLVLEAPGPGVYPFRVGHRAGFNFQEIDGAIVAAEWEITAFKWPREGDQPTPPSDLEAWRARANGPEARSATASSLRYTFGWGGPSEAGIGDAITEAQLGGDYFGVIARTRLPLDAGQWRVVTRSDDGVRVMVDGRVVLENWTHHGPTEDRGAFTLETPREVEIVVEHFEIAGYAVLEFGIEAVEDR
jgi:parallel beta-helix repeat protein